MIWRGMGSTRFIYWRHAYTWRNVVFSFSSQILAPNGDLLRKLVRCDHTTTPSHKTDYDIVHFISLSLKNLLKKRREIIFSFNGLFWIKGSIQLVICCFYKGRCGGGLTVNTMETENRRTWLSLVGLICTSFRKLSRSIWEDKTTSATHTRGGAK